MANNFIQRQERIKAAEDTITAASVARRNTDSERERERLTAAIIKPIGDRRAALGV